MRFMPSASASCASGDSAPSDMPAESKRLRMDSSGSTSSSGIGVAPAFSFIRSRIIATGRVFDDRGIFLELGVIAGLHRLLQLLHHVRVVGVEFLAEHELQQAAGRQRTQRIECGLVQQFLVGFEVVEVGAGNARHRALQAQLDHIFMHAHALEQLGAAVARHQRDAHLGEHLVQALVHALAEVGQRLVEVGLDLAGLHEFADDLVGEIGIHGGGAVADQAGVVMRVAHAAGFHHDVGVAAQAGGDQCVVHRAGGEQGVDRQAILGDVAVGQDEDDLAGLHRIDRACGQRLQRSFQRGRRRVVVQVERGRGECRVVQVQTACRRLPSTTAG